MADKGKVKDIKDDGNGIIIDKRGNEYTFSHQYFKELCINAGDEVKFDLVTLKAGTPATALNVERLTAGTISSYDPTSCTGEILEKKSDKRIKFYQPFCSELGYRIGDDVRYSLIKSSKGEELAVNLTGVGE